MHASVNVGLLALQSFTQIYQRELEEIVQLSSATCALDP